MMIRMMIMRMEVHVGAKVVREEEKGFVFSFSQSNNDAGKENEMVSLLQ